MSTISVLAKSRTEHLPNINLQAYRYINLLCDAIVWEELAASIFWLEGYE
jgi:hypothetical protein